MQISGKIVLLPVLMLCLAACSDEPQYVRLSGFAQGGTYSVTCSLPQNGTPSLWSQRRLQSESQRLALAVDSLLQAIDNSVSGYNRGSILSRLNAGEDVALDEHFVRIFTISQKMCEESGGAFDPSAGPLFDLWGFGFTVGGEVTLQAVDSVLQLVGMSHFAIDTAADGSLHLRRDDSRCKLNFNAIAQGYTCDAIDALLRSEGCRNLLVEVGGEIICRGSSPRGGLWSIGVEAPDGAGGVSGVAGEQNRGVAPQLKDTLHLTDCAVVTSGNYHKHSDKGGHIIDPRTGMPTKEILRSETVIVPCAESDYPCAVADARATVNCLK